ncbi:MAG: hypothetical protein IT349_19445 [Candidatus Eisenbacteria bacterium]|nr:hypothetical protein [Candidatus Eisenbacteria bacterium]
MSARNRPTKTFRWTLQIEVPGTLPPVYELATGKSRDRNAALRTALQGRLLQLKALQAQTRTSVLTFTLLLPGEIKETMTWKLTQTEVEKLATQAYPPRPSRR